MLQASCLDNKPERNLTTIAQRNLAAGEIAPALWGRADLTKYQTGLRTCRNFLIGKAGGAYNRPGSQFVCEVKDSSKTVRLIPFVFNSSQTHVLEFGDLYVRFITDGVQVKETAVNISSISQLNPAGVATSTATAFATGDEVYISGVLGMTEINNRNYKIIVTSTSTFTLTHLDGSVVDSTAFSAYTSGGTVERIYTVVTTYTEAELPEIRFAQSKDVVFLAHQSHAPAKLSRLAANSWTLADCNFALPTGPTGLAASGGTGTARNYKVTAIFTDGQESAPSAVNTGAPAWNNISDTIASPISLTWVAPTPPTGTTLFEYNVYCETSPGNGIYGFISASKSALFVHQGQSADPNDNVPEEKNPFSTSSDYPTAVGIKEQRMLYGGTVNKPESVFGSQTAAFSNFTVNNPLQDDDGVEFKAASQKVNTIKHLLNFGRLLVFTSDGELVVNKDGSPITPSDISLDQKSFNGSGAVAPVIINDTVVYVQARTNKVMWLGYNYQTDGYQGDDLSVFAAHLFEGYTLSDSAFQQTPNNILWLIRSDGTLLGLTYVKAHEIAGWHHHDTDGSYENVASVPEGSEDAVYTVVKRTVEDETKRYIERFYTRFVDDIVDSVFLDCALSYDGRNTGSQTMTLSGGVTWASGETLTLTTSLAAYFTAADVDNGVFITDAAGDIIRCRITAFTSGTIVSVKAEKDIPTDLQAASTTTWAKAVDEVAGLWHLEDEEVAVFGDGYVVANPNNASFGTPITVTDGTITTPLDGPSGKHELYAVIHVGLPYTSDLETLDIEDVGGQTLTAQKKAISLVTLQLEKTRGVWVGAHPPADDATDNLQFLAELKIRNDQVDSPDWPTPLYTGKIDVVPYTRYDENGHVFIRQIDPVPAAILGIAPTGVFGR